MTKIRDLKTELNGITEKVEGISKNPNLLKNNKEFSVD